MCIGIAAGMGKRLATGNPVQNWNTGAMRSVGRFSMDRLKFGNITWLQNPEIFQVNAMIEPKYTIHPDATISYQGLGPLCRVIQGSGVFQGKDAVRTFNALSVYMAAKFVGNLIHPIWGTFKVCLVQLKMEQSCREDYIEYGFVFREVDENGMIPPLPENKP